VISRAYDIVAALHKAAREICEEEPCEIYYPNLFKHLERVGGDQNLWLSLREWLGKTRLAPILGEFIEGGIRLSGLGAELCRWVYEVEEKLLSQAQGTTLPPSSKAPTPPSQFL
jgi:hypothetical protein